MFELREIFHCKLLFVVFLVLTKLVKPKSAPVGEVIIILTDNSIVAFLLYIAGKKYSILMLRIFECIFLVGFPLDLYTNYLTLPIVKCCSQQHIDDNLIILNVRFENFYLKINSTFT